MEMSGGRDKRAISSRGLCVRVERRETHTGRKAVVKKKKEEMIRRAVERKSAADVVL